MNTVSLYAVIDIFIALFNLCLGALVLWNNSRRLVNKTFFIIELFFSGWAISLFLYENPLIGTSLFWIRLTYLFVTVFTSTIFLFSYIFPNYAYRKAWLPARLFVVGYALISIWMLFFTPYFIQSVAKDSNGVLQTSLGNGYIFWGILAWIPFIWASLNFIRRGKKVTPRERIQMQFFWPAFVIFGVLVCIPDVIIPLVYKDTRFFALSPIANIVFSGTIAYLILKHRFMDLGRITREFAALVVSFVSLWVLYVGVIIVIGNFFFRQYASIPFIASGVLTALFIKYLTRPVRRKLEEKVNKFFHHGLYDREDLLHSIAQASITTIKMSEMIDKFFAIMCDAFQATFATAVGINGGKVVLLRTYCPQGKIKISLSPQEGLLLEKVNTIVLTQELESGDLKKFLSAKHVAVVIPMSVTSWKRFTLLGEKYSQSSYFSYDIRTLQLMQPTLTLTGEHMRQVAQIKKFNQRLKKEVLDATAELRLVNQHLQAADSMKDDFISIASHELKTPITAIKGFVWLTLRKEKKLSHYAKEKLTQVMGLTEQLDLLVNDMLDTSKLEGRRMKLHPEKFNIGEVAEEVRDELLPVSMQKRTIITIHNEKSLFVHADKRRIHQVIRNLLTNAVKYSRDKGKVDVRFRIEQKYVIVEVVDNGVGIKKSDLGKLFTKFGKLEGSSMNAHLPGTGLGLYITKSIIELSGGKVFVRSTVGKGSTFGFTLPKP